MIKLKDLLIESKIDKLANLYIDMLDGKPIMKKVRDSVKKLYKSSGNDAIEKMAEKILKLTKGKYKPVTAVEDLYTWSYGKTKPEKFKGKHGTKWMRDF